MSNPTVEGTSTTNNYTTPPPLEPHDLNVIRPGQQVALVFPDLNQRRITARVIKSSTAGIELQIDDASGLTKDNNFFEILRRASKPLLAATKKTFWKTTRRAGVLLVNTALRKPLLALIRPTFLFAVYGNERDVGTYYTPRMLRWMPPLIIAGFIKNGRHRGLMIGSKYLETELAADSEKVRDYIQSIGEEFGQIQRVALVGRLPNFVMKAGLQISAPYVDGSMGTRFMIWDAARKMRSLPQYANEISLVVLGGAGRIGSLICEDLARSFSVVIAFDPRHTEEKSVPFGSGGILYTADPAHLRQHKLFICLTHHGDAIAELKSYFSPGSLIADDTHPCISLKVRKELALSGVQVKKIVLTHDTFSTTPRMPSWNNRDLPGCLVEALVLLEHGGVDVTEFEAFRETAERVGYKGLLIEPRKE